MGPLGHPTICHSVIVLQHVCLSVCRSVRRDFRAFAGERVEGMAWNFKCWCILTIFRADEIMVTVCWFSSVWRHFDLVKRVKFWVSGLMYLDHLQNWLVYGHSQLIFLILALFWLSEMGQIWHYRAFPRERMEGIACNFACCSILTTFRTLVGYCCLAPKRQRCHLSDKMRKI